MATAGKFLLYGMQAGIKEIFDISGFSSVFSIFDSEEQACSQ
jgi:anti-anti-sigma regulatory factor